MRVVGQEDGSQSNVQPKTENNGKGSSGNAAVHRVSFSPSPSPSPSVFFVQTGFGHFGCWWLQ